MDVTPPPSSPPAAATPRGGSRRRWAGRAMLAASALIGLGVWLAAILLFARPALRTMVDLSPQARFTVSPATAELLHDVRTGTGAAAHLAGAKVELHAFYLPPPANLPTPEEQAVAAIVERVQGLTSDLLRQYRYLGGDAVEVVHHDQSAQSVDPRARDAHERFQVREGNVLVVAVGKRHRKLSLLHEMAVLDLPTPAERITPGRGQRPPALASYKGEEALSSALKSLLVEGTPVAYVLSGYGEASLERADALSYSALAQSLEREGFEVRQLALGTAGRVPEDAAVLALLEPRYEVPEAHAEILEAWLRRGGRMVLAVSYVLVPEDHNPRLAALGQRLGFALGSDLVCALYPDPANRDRRISGIPEVQNLEIRDLDASHPVTAPLARQNRVPVLKAAREILPLENGNAPPGVRFEPLLRTPNYAWLEERGPDGEVDWVAPRDLGAFRPRCVGAIVEVDPPPAEAAFGSELQGPPAPPRKGVLAIVSGVAFSNMLLEQNRDLALNLFQWLAERRALVTVRGSTYVARSLQLAPQQIARIGWLLIAGVPGAILVLGLLVFWRRSRDA